MTHDVSQEVRIQLLEYLPGYRDAAPPGFAGELGVSVRQRERLSPPSVGIEAMGASLAEGENR